MAVFWITFFTLIVASPLVIQSSNEECGRSFVGHRQPRNWTEVNQGRIINGKKSLKGAWPWQVSLQLLHPKFGLIRHWCGAVLIEPIWILTAAHCIHNDLFNLPLATLWTAVLGDWDRDVEENTEIRVPIDKIIVHENFHNYQNDIAIMKLTKPVEISTICLPDLTKYSFHQELTKAINISTNESKPLVTNSNLLFMSLRRGRRLDSGNKKANSNGKRGSHKTNHIHWLSDQIQKISAKFRGTKKPIKPDTYSYAIKNSAKCVATGWGRYNAHGPMTSTLLQATIPLHDNSLCQAKYGNNIPIRTGHLCAGHLDGTSGTCVGDSGGPLQCSLKDGRWFLAGITSFGSGCAKPGYPDVYTRLAFYIPWINQQINKYKDENNV